MPFPWHQECFWRGCEVLHSQTTAGTVGKSKNSHLWPDVCLISGEGMKALATCYDISVSPQNALDIPTENITFVACRGWEGPSPPLCAAPTAELQQHHITRGSWVGARGLGWHRVANSAAAVPQCQVPFTWRDKRGDTVLRVTEIQCAWESFAAFSNLSEKNSLQQSFCNPTGAKNVITGARPAQHWHSSRVWETAQAVKSEQKAYIPFDSSNPFPSIVQTPDRHCFS